MNQYELTKIITITVIVFSILFTISHNATYGKKIPNVLNKIIPIVLTILLIKCLKTETAEDYFMQQRDFYNMKVAFETKDKIKKSIRNNSKKK
jgi:type III secretory pathway component EscR